MQTKPQWGTASQLLAWLKQDKQKDTGSEDVQEPLVGLWHNAVSMEGSIGPSNSTPRCQGPQKPENTRLHKDL